MQATPFLLILILYISYTLYRIFTGRSDVFDPYFSFSLVFMNMYVLYPSLQVMGYVPFFFDIDPGIINQNFDFAIAIITFCVVIIILSDILGIHLGRRFPTTFKLNFIKSSDSFRVFFVILFFFSLAPKVYMVSQQGIVGAFIGARANLEGAIFPGWMMFLSRFTVFLIGFLFILSCLYRSLFLFLLALFAYPLVFLEGTKTAIFLPIYFLIFGYHYYIRRINVFVVGFGLAAFLVVFPFVRGFIGAGFQGFSWTYISPIDGYYSVSQRYFGFETLILVLHDLRLDLLEQFGQFFNNIVPRQFFLEKEPSFGVRFYEAYQEFLSVAYWKSTSIPPYLLAGSMLNSFGTLLPFAIAFQFVLAQIFYQWFLRNPDSVSIFFYLRFLLPTTTLFVEGYPSDALVKLLFSLSIVVFIYSIVIVLFLILPRKISSNNSWR